jgi:hypothetical protein
MRAEIVRTSPERLQKISLTRTEYNLAKEGEDELEWNGTMYDIASIKFDRDKVEVLALPDTSETNLISFLTKLLQSTKDDSQTAPSALLQFLSLTFTVTDPAVKSITRAVSFIKHDTIYQKMESNFHCSISAPPPRS